MPPASARLLTPTKSSAALLLGERSRPCVREAAPTLRLAGGALAERSLDEGRFLVTLDTQPTVVLE